MHEEWMRLALTEAMKTADDVPVGAIVVREGAIIAAAHNERERTGDPLAHAEVLALQRAARVLGTRRLSGCALYVTLEPCPMCAGAAIMAGIDLLVFGAYDSAYGCCGSRYLLPADSHFNHQVPCVGGVLQKESEQLLNSFFKTLRR